MEKTKEKKIEEPIALERRRIKSFAVDSEQTEFKLLEKEDIDDVVSVLRRTAFEIGEKEIKELEEIIRYKTSYGAYVDRLLVGLSLSWPLCFNELTKSLYSCNEANTLYLQDIAILIAFEGHGIREKLIELTEQRAKEKKLNYVVCVCGENPKEDELNYVIEKRGTKLERALYNANYKFFKGHYGLTAYKRLV
ncbi:MAG: hypothetical protein QXS91_01325 [Candidatus Anstonellales archaeon]